MSEREELRAWEILDVANKCHAEPPAEQAQSVDPLVARLTEWLHKWPGGAPNEVWSVVSDIVRAGTTSHAIVGAFNAALIAKDQRIAEQVAEIERLRGAIARESRDIEQTLGRALGYPRYCDDQKNFPGATDADGVCVGDHVPASLAAEAANALQAANARADALREALRGMVITGPTGCTTLHCEQCDSEPWPYSTDPADETHRPGCLAAPTGEKT